MAAHARLGPSNHRWPHCPGSIREEARYPNTSGAAAIDGTGSHLLLELCLEDFDKKKSTEAIRADQYLGQLIGVNSREKPNGWSVDEARCERVQMCLNYVHRRIRELKEWYKATEIYVHTETRSDPGQAFGRDDWWGTVDITISAKLETGSRYTEIVDYKDGQQWVEEKNNSQLIGYLFGKMHAKGLMTTTNPQFRMTIVQPKTSRPIRYWCSMNPDHKLSLDVLRTKVNELGAAAKATDDPNAPCISGKHCQWCRANPKRGGHCTAATEKSLETMNKMTTLTTTGDQNMFEVIQQAVSDVKSLTVEQLRELADAKPALIAAFDKVETEIEERIEQGVEVPGYAMVPGKASKKWAKPEEDVAKMLKGKRLKKADIYPEKLISPAQVLKLEQLDAKQKQKIEDDFISVVAGKMTLKRVAEKREEVDVTPEEKVEMMFGGIEPEKAEAVTFDQPQEEKVEMSFDQPEEQPITFM